MNPSNRILFISYDGMTDPLGQSQVIPYLAGLVEKGHSITLLSCEKSDNFHKHEQKIRGILEKANIQWNPVAYRKSPPVISTLLDVRTMTKTAKALHKKKPFDLIHCRSYISALVGLKMKRQLGTRFVFDMRGFWADERVDGKLWNLKNPIFNQVYKYFKKKEIQFLSEADYTISLTKNAADEIHSWEKVANQPIPIQVIPCCVDLNLFDPDTKKKEIDSFKEKIQIPKDTFILSYIGSIGTWYMLDEMMDFFVVLKEDNSNARFLFVTKDNPDSIVQCAVNKGLSKDDLIITSSEREDVPSYIMLSDLSIFFIKPVFSKKASSPTKQGEIMAMDVPVICNTGVGDTNYVIENFHSGVLISDFNAESYRNALVQYKTGTFENLRKGAEVFFSLENGLNSYNEVYQKVIKKDHR